MEPSGKNLSGQFTLKAAASLTLACALFLSAAWAVRATLSYSDTLKFTPVEVSLQDGTEAQQAEASRLFDRDTRTGFTLGGTSLVTADLESSGELRAIRIYGPSHYTLNVEAEENGTWQPVPGLRNLDLSDLSEGWNTLETPRPMTVGKVRFQLIRTGDEERSGHKELKEIEIWGKARRLAIKDGSALLDSLRGDTPPFQARKYEAKPQQGVIMPEEKDDPSDNLFSFRVDRKPSDFKKVYLSYELYGLSHWEGTLRTLNGKASLGGQQFAIAGSWSTQVEPIDPALLTQGNNTIQFFPVQGMKSGYTVRNVKLMAELEDGSNFVSQVSLHGDKGDKLLPALTDGDLNTGWSPSEAKKSGESHPQLIATFDRPTQVSSLNLNISGPLKGKVSLEFFHDGEWVKGSKGEKEKEKESEHDSEEDSSWAEGWNSVSLRHAPVAESLRITFEDISNSGEIRELSLTGSGVGGREGYPDIHITYPDAGQFIGRTAYIRGYVTPADNGSGSVALTIGGKSVTLKDGAFELLVSKDDLGFKNQHDSDAWSADVKATYPDGKKLSTTLKLNSYSAPVPASANPNLPDYSFAVEPGENKKLDYDGAELEINPGALDGEMTFGITPLKETDLPKLDPGMTNVTRGAVKGYRFTPHGAKFRNKIKVHLPYDKALLPKGATEQEIKTYYYDEVSGRWRELERMAVDPVKGELVSYTNHFTNMINATVTVPDHPGLTSFNPTSIKDIKAADPGAGINLIEPPQANNMGDARLSYPIEIPPGRNGMQPQIAVNYNSSGGNGWMGLGWDIPVQSITVDTRWGVPRYDKDNETETYLLDGEQLTPVAHRGAFQPRDTSGSKIFHPRVEGQFRKIVRLGNSPSTYSWEVTDKNGTKYIYGQSSGAVLAGPKGIFRWMLQEVRDTNGNTIKYTYSIVSDTGIVNGTVPGTQIYLQQIAYTGSVNGPAPYTVTFKRDRDLPNFTRRPDVSIDARSGFKVVTADLLKTIEVSYNGALVRSYDFSYREGAFRKTLLDSVTQKGETGQVFNTHTFSYYDDIRDAASNYAGFSTTPETWTTPADTIPMNMLGEDVRASALSGSQEHSGGFSFYFGYNPAGWSKAGSGGFKVGSSHSNSHGVLMMMDINGDGLPDKVFAHGNAIAYRPQVVLPDGTHTFGQSTDIQGHLALSQEESDNNVAGGEWYPWDGISATYDKSYTYTQSDTYVTDANGDGLPDIVMGGEVYFCYKDSDGKIKFDTDSSLTPVPLLPSITASGAADTAEMDKIYQAMLKAHPLMDSVRRWVAPYSGTIRVTGAVHLNDHTLDPEPTPDKKTTTARKDYKTADGVRVTIEKGNGPGVTGLWSARITESDYGDHSPTGVDSISVSKGDRIYFRVNSVNDGAYDDVTWAPQIQYLNVGTARDVNNLDPYRYKASEDFVYSGRTAEIQVPLTGTLRITGDLLKKGATSDDITLAIYRKGINDSSPSVAFSANMGWASAGAIPMTDASGSALEIKVNAMDRLTFKVLSDTPIDLKQLQWLPKAFYTSATAVNASGQAEVVTVVDKQGNYLLQVNPTYDMDYYPEDRLGSPQQSWQPASSGTLLVNAVVSCSQYNAASLMNKAIIFTVKGKNRLLAKQQLFLRDGKSDGAGGIILKVPVTVNYVAAGEDLYFDFTTKDAAVATQANYGVELGSAFPQFDVHWTVADTSDVAFPKAYRGWSVIGYRGDDTWATAPIDESRLVVNTPDNPSNEKANATLADKTTAYPFAALPGLGLWGGQDDNCWIKPTQQSSTRLGKDYVSRPGGGLAGTGAMGVIKFTYGDQDVLGFSVGVVPQISAGASTASGHSHSSVDFVDMNGDRFPDVVRSGSIQYTLPTGNLGSTVGANAVNLRQNANNSVSFSAGSHPFAQPSADNADVLMKVESSVGINGSFSGGDSSNELDLIDINGDGLPDNVNKSGNVSLNTGYGFTSSEHYGMSLDYTNSSSTSLGAGLGYNFADFGWGGGLSKGSSVNDTQNSLVDINGDGLPDMVSIDKNGNLLVAFNTGNGFAPAVAWGKAAISKSNTVSLSSSAYFSIIIPIPLTPSSIVINPGVNWSDSMSRQEFAIRDVDGDGYPDFVTSSDERNVTFYRNNVGRTNLLKSVKRPLGATISLEYDRVGNTYQMPQSKWVLSKTTVDDGMANIMTQPNDGGAHSLATSYEYQAGYQDRLERDFYGFERVTESQLDTASGNKPYRRIVRVFENRDYYQKGLLISETLKDDAGLEYTRTENKYDTVPDLATLTPEEKLTATVFPQLTRTTKHFYEGGKGEKKTIVRYEYDPVYGNVTRYVDEGEPGIASDDVTADIQYTNDTTHYIVGKPKSIRVTAAGVEMRHREAEFDPNNGNLLVVREYLADGTAAITELKYNANGTLLSVQGPENLHKQRYAVNYTYDDMTQSYVIKIGDSFGLSSTADYNYKFGKVKLSTDSNGNIMATDYDQFGRISGIKGPYEQSGQLATLSFEYHPSTGSGQVPEPPVNYAVTKHLDMYRNINDPIETVLFTDGLKRVIQTKKDDAFSTSILRQGSGGTPRDGMSVSGRVKFDGLGRIVEQYYPVEEGLGSQSVFNPKYDTITPTRMTYDVLDRNLTTTLPDTTVTRMDYGFGNDRNGMLQFATTVMDANGKSKTSFRDVNELITAVKESNNGATIWTSYSYDPLKQITQVMDDQKNLTLITYDNLGRRTSIDNPDTGKTETLYDLAGNVTAKITANLRSEGKQISYDYDFGRLVSISYPNFPENNVTYTYGAVGAPFNGAGRIVKVNDGSGTEERFYGKLGEIVKEIKTIKLSAVSDQRSADSKKSESRSQKSEEKKDSEIDTRQSSIVTYTTQYTYDTFGRIQKLVYPDGEVLTYKYNSGGLLESASGSLGTQSFNYISRLEYDKFEQRVYLEVGNKAYTTYTYDANNRRLTNLNSVTTYVPEVEYDKEHGVAPPPPVPVTVNFQNLNYGYDNVGNILSLRNDIPVPSVPSEELRVKSEESGKKNSNLSSSSGDHVMYGPTSQSFGYDDLYRLVSARGTYTPAMDRVDRYSLSMSYDSIHNITRKNQLHEVMHSDDDHQVRFHREDKTSYDWVYSYTGSHPHAPTYIGDNQATFVTDEEHHPSGRNHYYDANGNQIGFDKVSPEEARKSESEKRGTGAKGKGNGKGDVMPAQPENPEDLRTIIWDEENRIVSISDHGKTQHYVYNDRGERVIKEGSEGRTVYVNQYYTVKDSTQTSKHVFAGPNRIATRVTHGDGQDHSHDQRSDHSKASDGHDNQEDLNIYYYHPDHLGSTGYVTDTKGRLYEHMEYFPFGETWVEEDQGSKLPYLFTSKELDTETGLYYYGARYYDPRTSVWQSADPVFEKYLNGRNKGGVYTSLNLALYTYTYNDPIILIDPDGNLTIAIEYNKNDPHGAVAFQLFENGKAVRFFNSWTTRGVNTDGTETAIVMGLYHYKVSLFDHFKDPNTGKPGILAPQLYGTVPGDADHADDKGGKLGGHIPTLGPNQNHGGENLAFGEYIHPIATNAQVRKNDPKHGGQDYYWTEGCNGTDWNDFFDKFMSGKKLGDEGDYGLIRLPNTPFNKQVGDALKGFGSWLEKTANDIEKNNKKHH